MEDLVQQRQECQETLQHLQASQGNTLRAYGEWMVNLVSALQRERQRFRVQPKGPLGKRYENKQ